MSSNFDFSEKSEELKSDVVLVLDNPTFGQSEFHVNKTLLSIHSSVFSTMFSEKYKESTCDKIPLKDVCPIAFQVLLEVLYHKTELTGDKACDILELVNYFDFKDIKKKCAAVLMSCSDEEVELKEKIFMADQFMFPELMEACLAKITSVRQLQEVTPEDVKELNPSTVLLLLQKMVDLPKAPLNHTQSSSGDGRRNRKKNWNHAPAPARHDHDDLFAELERNNPNPYQVNW